MFPSRTDKGNRISASATNCWQRHALIDCHYLSVAVTRRFFLLSFSTCSSTASPYLIEWGKHSQHECSWNCDSVPGFFQHYLIPSHHLQAQTKGPVEIKQLGYQNKDKHSHDIDAVFKGRCVFYFNLSLQCCDLGVYYISCLRYIILVGNRWYVPGTQSHQSINFQSDPLILSTHKRTEVEDHKNTFTQSSLRCSLKNAWFQIITLIVLRPSHIAYC